MKILIIGANGQVGSELSSVLPYNLSTIPTAKVLSVSRKDLDMRDFSEIGHFLKRIAPNIIVNATAYTTVDKAELEQQRAFAVNHNAVTAVAKYCNTYGCLLLHISTDYVFDGKSSRPYTEADRVGPLSVYGRSKLAGEDSIREILDTHIILRTSWVFGARGNNFVKSILKLAENKAELDVVADQIGAPTAARAIAETISKIIDQLAFASGNDKRWGTYHFSGAPFTSWADFANEIMDQALHQGILAHRPKVNLLKTEDYPTTAARPASSMLDCS